MQVVAAVVIEPKVMIPVDVIVILTIGNGIASVVAVTIAKLHCTGSGQGEGKDLQK